MSALPLARGGPGSAASGGPSSGGSMPLPSAEELLESMSMTRTILVFIAIFAIASIVVILLNIMWGAGKRSENTEEEEVGSAPLNGSTAGDRVETKTSYPNKIRDYIALSISSITFILVLSGVWYTFPGASNQRKV